MALLAAGASMQPKRAEYPLLSLCFTSRNNVELFITHTASYHVYKVRVSYTSREHEHREGL